MHNTTWIFHEWNGLSDGQWLLSVYKHLLFFFSWHYSEKGQRAFNFFMSVLFLALPRVFIALPTEGCVKTWCLWVVKKTNSFLHSFQNTIGLVLVCLGFFVSVCILMIKTCKQLVLGKIIWLTEIRAIYVKLSSAWFGCATFQGIIKETYFLGL